MNPASSRPTSSDIYREVGALGANASAQEKRLDRIEQAIERGFADLKAEIGTLNTKVADEIGTLNQKVTDLQTKDLVRGRVQKTLLAVATTIGAVVSLAINALVQWFSAH